MFMTKATENKLTSYTTMQNAIRQGTDHETQMTNVRSAFPVGSLFRLLVSCFR